MDLRDQRFGIEIEFTGITREQAAQVVAKYFHATESRGFGRYDNYQISDEQNRIWKIVYDSSITSQRKTASGRRIYADESYKVEFVSPICKYDDIPKIQQIVRDFRHKGGFISEKCGIHVHVDASNHDVRSLRNIMNIMASKEDIFYKALDIKVSRQNYCKKADTHVLEQINRRKPQTKEQLSRLWYGGNSRQDNHYDSTRYHALNLHSVFDKGTVEFRMFNSTLHAGKVKTYIQFSLAISAQAINQKKASPIRTQSTNEKYTFRTWLLRLGMKGKEFETARKFLLENLDGCIAWKDLAQAEAQKERLRAKREIQSNEQPSSVISASEPVSEDEQQNNITMSM